MDDLAPAEHVERPVDRCGCGLFGVTLPLRADSNPPAHYAPCPRHVAEKVIADAHAREEARRKK